MGATSWQVKQRYNNKVYRSVSIRLKKELVEAWNTALEEDEISKAEFLRRAIEQYLENRKEQQK